MKNNKNETSWEIVSDWYSEALNSEKWYFHKNIILPKSLKLLKLKSEDSLLDLGCGDGILSGVIPNGVDYLGVDISPSLIREGMKNSQEDMVSAQKSDPTFTPSSKQFVVGDISKKLFLKRRDFSHAAIILALQNVERLFNVFANANYYLKKEGKFLLVLNHPYFRIPKHTSWEIDKVKRIQYRRVDRYYSNIKIPIDMTPGSAEDKKFTYSFHYSLEYISDLLKKNGFVIEKIEEWVSNKKSEGKAAQMENFARSEFPVFMAILCSKHV